MASNSLINLLIGIEEVRYLQKANTTPLGGMPERPRVVRAINRSSVVLLSSHLERYLWALVEESVNEINRSSVVGSLLPERLRLQHSQVAIEKLSQTQWTNRRSELENFALQDSWLWSNAPKSDLSADRLLQWMKSPSPKRIKRLFAMWGVDDVFAEITRQPHTKNRLWLKLNELIEKRNNIAHGDATTEATSQDVRSYLSAVQDFCTRADKVLSRALRRHLGVTAPW